MAGPLAGVRVLDLSREVAGAYATKLLADYGADVLKLEPPGGGPLRRFGPFPGDEPHPERSGLFLHLNTNKRSRVLDATDPASAARIRALAAEADIVVEDFAPGRSRLLGMGLGGALRRARRPRAPLDHPLRPDRSPTAATAAPRSPPRGSAVPCT